jgi:hypothetical protein
MTHMNICGSRRGQEQGTAQSRGSTVWTDPCHALDVIEKLTSRALKLGISGSIHDLHGVGPLLFNLLAMVAELFKVARSTVLRIAQRTH